MFSIKITGFKNLRDSLARLGDMENNVLDPARRKWLKGLRATLKSKPYPPKIPLQIYIRTGNLANRWAVTDDSIINSADYAGWVVGDEQAMVHLGRWWTAREAAQDEAGELGQIIIKEIAGQWH